jgi:hypothetical protein
VKTKIRKQLAVRKRRMAKRLDKTTQGPESLTPGISATNIEYEIADRSRAIGAGGIGAMQQMVKWLGLDREINLHVNVLKLHLPYSESDHVQNIAFNLLAGGTCLEHLELRRNDEAYLDALGAQRIPDPTTAGDFCRRFDPWKIHQLMEAVNNVRVKVWQQQPDAFFDQAIIEADGTMVETYGECKQGTDFNHKGQYGYHPLVVTLANTKEVLYVVNRSGNRPSHEKAAGYFDRSIALCRRAGFRQIRLRGDTDFSQTEYLDGWDTDGVTFVFGYDATDNLYEAAECLELTDWKPLKRAPRYEVKTEPRGRRANVKEANVIRRNYKNIKLQKEWVAEFSYRPTACNKDYRIVVVWKDLEERQGQQKLWDFTRCFFYITNDWSLTPEEVVFEANQRCNQENVIQQDKSDVHALTAPLDNLESNWAYMVIATLAWNLKAWSALLLPISNRWKDRHTEEKSTLLRMDFSTFRHAMIHIPAQIVRKGRKLVYRLLGWNHWQSVFFRLLDRFRQPLRC